MTPDGIRIPIDGLAAHDVPQVIHPQARTGGGIQDMRLYGFRDFSTSLLILHTTNISESIVEALARYWSACGSGVLAC